MSAPRPARTAALLFQAVAPAAAADCPYPLGDFIPRGDFHAYPTGGDDPAFQVVDAIRVRPQYALGPMVYDGSTIHFVYEADEDYLPPNSTVESETHVLVYKEYSQDTGWNVTRQWIASQDITEEVPPGRHVQPTMSLAGGDLWVAWQVAGWTVGGEWWPQTGTYMLYRAKLDGQWGPIQPLSSMANGTSSRLARSVPFGAGVYVAYQTDEGELDTTTFRVVGRTLGRSGVGPIEDISVGGDLFSDETVQLVTDGQRLIAVWAARNTTEFAGEGEWRVWAAERGPGGSWGQPVAVSERSKLANMNPTAAFFGGDLYVAWSTNDPSISPGGDRSIVLRKVDMATGAVGGVIEITNASQPGFEDSPSVIEWAGALQVIWTSRSSIDAPGNVTGDSDTHWRSWDGASLSPITVLSPSAGDTFDEIGTGFLVVGDSLHATFMMDINEPGSGLEQDQRQMTRTLLPGQRASERYEAEYVPLAPVPADAAEAAVEVRFRHVGGPSVPATDHFGLLLADGRWVPVAPDANGRVTLHVTGGVVDPPLNATWCGQPIPIAALPAPTVGFLEANLPFVVVGALVAAAAVAVVLLRQRGRDADALSEEAPRDEP